MNVDTTISPKSVAVITKNVTKMLDRKRFYRNLLHDLFKFKLPSIFLGIKTFEKFRFLLLVQTELHTWHDFLQNSRRLYNLSNRWHFLQRSCRRQGDISHSRMSRSLWVAKCYVKNHSQSKPLCVLVFADDIVVSYKRSAKNILYNIKNGVNCLLMYLNMPIVWESNDFGSLDLVHYGYNHFKRKAYFNEKKNSYPHLGQWDRCTAISVYIFEHGFQSFPIVDNL